MCYYIFFKLKSNQSKSRVCWKTKIAASWSSLWTQIHRRKLFETIRTTSPNAWTRYALFQMPISCNVPSTNWLFLPAIIMQRKTMKFKKED